MVVPRLSIDPNSFGFETILFSGSGLELDPPSGSPCLSFTCTCSVGQSASPRSCLPIPDIAALSAHVQPGYPAAGSAGTLRGSPNAHSKSKFPVIIAARNVSTYAAASSARSTHLGQPSRCSSRGASSASSPIIPRWYRSRSWSEICSMPM